MEPAQRAAQRATQRAQKRAKLENPPPYCSDKILQFKLALNRFDQKQQQQPVVIDLELESPPAVITEEADSSVEENGCDPSTLCSITMCDEQVGGSFEVSLDKFKCETCEVVSHSQAEWDQHLSCHGAVADFMCLLCDYAVMTAEGLVEHMKVHKKTDQNLVTSTTTTSGQSR